MKLIALRVDVAAVVVGHTGSSRCKYLRRPTYVQDFFKVLFIL